jgi:hypothetical protein
VSGFPGATFAVEPNPLCFGQVPQKDIRVRVVRLTLLGEGVRVSNSGKSISDVPEGQPPSGFLWGSLTTDIPFYGICDFPVHFMPRQEPAEPEA